VANLTSGARGMSLMTLAGITDSWWYYIVLIGLIVVLIIVLKVVKGRQV
jgi:hypothetical protein